VEWGVGPHVEENELRHRYAAPWCDAYLAWGLKYDRAFEAAECHLSGQAGDSFPNPAEQAAFQLEGMLLAT
jgi:hypothetical protein